MTNAKEVSANKHSLGAWIASAWLIFFSVLFFTWWLLPEDMTLGVSSLSARFVFAFAHIFVASLLLFVGFLAVGATRWQIETADSSANPALSGDRSAKINVHNGVHTQFLSNTTEQFVMFSAAILAATPFLTQEYLRIVTLMSVMWIFGRLFFWGGYWYTAYNNLPTYPRAIGLGMGLLCTLSLASIAAIGVSLHFPAFTLLYEVSATAMQSEPFAFAGFLVPPVAGLKGSNLLPISFFTIIVIITATLALKPRLAPPVIPMAIICVIGWSWLLLSGAIPIRF